MTDRRGKNKKEQGLLIVYPCSFIFTLKNQYPRIALIPGSSRPSINSSRAPPPVDT
jgi:hypothetical protein